MATRAKIFALLLSASRAAASRSSLTPACASSKVSLIRPDTPFSWYPPSCARPSVVAYGALAAVVGAGIYMVLATPTGSEDAAAESEPDTTGDDSEDRLNHKANDFLYWSKKKMIQMIAEQSAGNGCELVCSFSAPVPSSKDTVLGAKEKATSMADSSKRKAKSQMQGQVVQHAMRNPTGKEIRELTKILKQINTKMGKGSPPPNGSPLDDLLKMIKEFLDVPGRLLDIYAALMSVLLYLDSIWKWDGVTTFLCPFSEWTDLVSITIEKLQETGSAEDTFILDMDGVKITIKKFDQDDGSVEAAVVVDGRNKDAFSITIKKLNEEAEG